MLRATSGLAEQLRETIILGIFRLLVLVGVLLGVTLLAFTPEGIVFYLFGSQDGIIFLTIIPSTLHDLDKIWSQT